MTNITHKVHLLIKTNNDNIMHLSFCKSDNIIRNKDWLQKFQTSKDSPDGIVLLCFQTHT
jgi:hypothetical protein